MSGARHRFRRREGVALVAALGLLLLAAALLAGSATASVELRRATRTKSWAARAELECWRALGEVLQGWSATLDSMPIGATVERPVSASTSAGPAVVVTVRVRRLSARSYATGVVARVGPAGQGVSRRARLLLARGASRTGGADTTVVSTLARWRIVDLR